MFTLGFAVGSFVIAVACLAWALALRLRNAELRRVLEIYKEERAAWKNESFAKHYGVSGKKLNAVLQNKTRPGERSGASKESASDGAASDGNKSSPPGTVNDFSEKEHEQE